MKKYALPALLAAIVAGLTLVASAFAAAPSNLTNPALSGTPKVGQTMTVSNGTWAGSPTSYSYQWQRCTSGTCTNIAGATAQSYTVRSADVGRQLRAVVTATNADGSSTANSNTSSTVEAASAAGAPANTGQPVVTGDATPGGVLTVTNGTWTNNPTSYTYQWLQCSGAGSACTVIPGATGRSYTVRFVDVYSSLRADVTAKNAAGSATKRSTKSDIVVPVEPVTTPGNKAPTITFISLKRLGQRVYARFKVCDDAPKGVEVIERDAKAGQLSYVRKFNVTPNSCITATRNWLPAPRFRTKGRYVVTLRAVDKSGASSRFVSRSLVR